MKKVTNKICSTVLAGLFILACSTDSFATDKEVDLTPSSEYTPITIMQSCEKQPVVAKSSGVYVADSIIGEPVTGMKEGNYDSVYWILNMSGSGGTCWIEFSCSVPVNLLEVKLAVDRSTGLWEYFDTVRVNNMAKNDDYVYARWDDGGGYLALAAYGDAYIDRGHVTGMTVNGWW